jgi:hypothetical protein
MKKSYKMQQTLMYNSQHTAKFEFSFLFNNYPSQFLSHWKLARPVFFREELSFLPYKKKSDSVLGGKFKFADFC